MRKRIFESEIFYFFLVFLLVYAGSNTLFAQVVLSTQVSIVFIASLLLVVYFVKGKVRTAKSSMIITIVLLLLLIFSTVINADAENFMGEMIIALKMLSGFLLFSCFDKVRIMRMFARVIIIISAASLIITYLFPVLGLEKLFPVITNASGIKFYNCLLSLKIDSYGFFSMRNYGIFSEPAVYCFYLFIAAMSELFLFIPSGRKYFCLILLCATMFTTFSPIGVLSGAVILVFSVIDMISAANVSSLRKTFFIALTIIIILIVVLLEGAQNLIDLAMSRSDLSTGSGQERIASIYYDLAYWVKRPIFGRSLKMVNVVTKYLGFNTSTTGTMLLSFGVFFGGIVTYMQYKTIRFFTLGRRWITTAVMFVVFMLAINNYSYIQNDWYWYFTFIGVCGANEI